MVAEAPIRAIPSQRQSLWNFRADGFFNCAPRQERQDNQGINGKQVQRALSRFMASETFLAYLSRFSIDVAL